MAVFLSLLMKMNYLCNMTKEEYIKECGVKSVKDLSDGQILEYYLAGNGSTRTQNSARDIKYGPFGMTPKEKAMGLNLLRKAFEQDKDLKIFYVTSEGEFDTIREAPVSHFEMTLEEILKEPEPRTETKEMKVSLWRQLLSKLF